jgi:hypothetical protein
MVHKTTPASAFHALTTREALLTFLSGTVAGTQTTLTDVERGAPVAGITAFLGVRETTLWFFDEGILANARPAEFWALADLAPGEAGVRVRTATGRTCSVVLMRRGGGTGEHDGEEEEEEEGEETEFQMIDGKEREVIREWVRKHRGAFGIATEVRGEEGDDDALAQAASHGAEAEAAEAAEKGDSDSDSDFEAESGDSDGGSPSSGSGSGSSSGSAPGPGPGGPESDAGSDAGSSEQEDEDEPLSGPGSEGDDDDMMELDPKHHPLLRAGGLPKMSKAAMDAAVELVVGDFVGKASRDASTPGSEFGPGLGRPTEVEGDDDEEDELED